MYHGDVSQFTDKEKQIGLCVLGLQHKNTRKTLYGIVMILTTIKLGTIRTVGTFKNSEYG